MARGWPSQDLRMRLEVVGRLPEGARMWLEGPAEFMDAIVENRPYLEIVKEGVAGLPINPHGVNRFREIVFPAKSRNQMQLLVEIPENQQNRAYRIYARQLYKGEEVGRVTWQLEPPSKVHRPDLSTEPVSHWIGISLLALALGWLWLYIWHWLRKQGRRS
jgi:serine protease